MTPKASELGSTPSLAKALYTLASSEGLRNSVAVKKKNEIEVMNYTFQGGKILEKMLHKYLTSK